VGVLFFMLGIVTSAQAADSLRVTSDTVLRATASWDGVRYERYPSGQPELTVLKITIPPHTELSWHQHGMPSVAYVLSGELTVETAGEGKVKHIVTGDAVSYTHLRAHET
jgi:quercetin dioxygenase-like cupin family protein